MKGRIGKVILISVTSLLLCTALVLASGEQETGAAEEVTKTDGFVVALSNSYIGNNWRTQMINGFKEMAEYYKEKGLISKYIVQSSGVDVNNQIAQIRNMINSGIDLLIIDPSSPTALNPIIEEANRRGITVISSSQPVTSPHAISVLVDQKVWGATLAEWFVEEIGGEGDIVIVSGLAGQPANIDRVNGQRQVLAEYSNINILTEVNGNWDQAAAQQVTSSVIASYPELDGVLTQDSMAMGVLQAFIAADRELPIITGETMVGYLHLWKKLKDERGFSTIGLNNPPSMVRNALGVGIRLLQGKEFRKPLDDNQYFYSIKNVVTNENFEEFYEEHKDKPDTYYPDEWMTEAELDAIFK
jgi:ribose transport system substrate-binding protein